MTLLLHNIHVIEMVGKRFINNAIRLHYSYIYKVFYPYVCITSRQEYRKYKLHIILV